jgi:hypothetical protein
VLKPVSVGRRPGPEREGKEAGDGERQRRGGTIDLVEIRRPEEATRQPVKYS